MANTFGNAQDLVAVADIRKNTVLLKDGGLRQIIMVGGVNFSLKSESEQNVLTAGYQSFLNGLNFPIQIIIHSRKINIENYLQTLEQKKGGETSPLLQNQIAEYSAFITGFVQENAIMAKTFFIVVPFTPISLPSKTKIFSFLPFGNKKTDEKVNLEEEKSFDESTMQLRQRVTQIIEGLTGIGLEAVVLDDEALVELFYNFYNPETVEKKGLTIGTTTHERRN